MANVTVQWSVLETTFEEFQTHHLRDAFAGPFIFKALDLVIHSPNISDDDRKILCQLADVLYLSRNNNWKDDCPMGDAEGLTRHVASLVPPRDKERWEAAEQGEELLCFVLRRAAVCLRSMAACFPPLSDSSPVEQHWLARSGIILSSQAQLVGVRAVTA